MNARAQLKMSDMKCPTCGANPSRRCRNPNSKSIVIFAGFHKERIALRYKVKAILASHFKVELRPCTGQAHKPGYEMQDHCMVCLPGWGTVEALVPNNEVLS